MKVQSRTGREVIIGRAITAPLLQAKPSRRILPLYSHSRVLKGRIIISTVPMRKLSLKEASWIT